MALALLFIVFGPLAAAGSDWATQIARVLVYGSALAATAGTVAVWRARNTPGSPRHLWLWSALSTLVLVGSFAYLTMLPDGPVIPLAGSGLYFLAYVGQWVAALVLVVKAQRHA